MYRSGYLFFGKHALSWRLLLSIQSLIFEIVEVVCCSRPPIPNRTIVGFLTDGKYVDDHNIRLLKSRQNGHRKNSYFDSTSRDYD